MSSSKIKIVVSVLVITFSVAYLIYDGVRDTMVYYLTVSEFHRTAGEGERYRVSGSVEENSVIKSAVGLLEFSITDGARSLAVSYRGAVPDTFREGVEAVVEGSLSPDARGFEADILLAKCPTKYQSAEDVYSESGNR